MSRRGDEQRKEGLIHLSELCYVLCKVGNRCTLMQHNSVPSLNNRLLYVVVVIV